MVVKLKIKKCHKMIKAKTILLMEFSSIKKLKIIVLYYNIYVSIYIIKLLFCNCLNSKYIINTINLLHNIMAIY